MSKIEFALFAPYNEKASLMGTFSDWKEIPMKKDKDGFFRASVDLKDGSYQYKYKIQSKSWFFEPDQWVEVTDPYATEIVDDETQNSVVYIKDGDRILDTYVWQNDQHPLPADHELVIYEMHVGDFSGGENDPFERGQFVHVIEKLDYLCELGVNAIELMPVKEYPGEHSWGYSPRYFFATESSYGTTADLKRLIDECHGHGIRVIMDGVYNHSEASSPLTQIDHDYWYHHSPRDPDNSWGPEFNYEFYDESLETYPARRFIGDTVRFWVENFHLDGIRYDAARQIANYDFMNWIVEETKQTAGAKPFINIAEHIPDTPDITNVDGPMDSCWHDSFYHTMLAHLCGERFDLEELEAVIDAKRRGYLGPTNVVNYLSNHDHNRLMVELGDREIFDDEAFRRLRLGMAILFTAVGIPMIWMGAEFGEYKPKTMEKAKLDWNLLKNDLNRNHFEFVKGLTRLRRENHALHTANIDFFHENPEMKIFAYGRWNDEGSRVVVVVNFSDQYIADYTLTDFPEDGTWHEWTYDYDVEVSDRTLTTNLAEYEAKIFVWH
ncbi:alpha-amylase family glycosyl hydrolase [Leptolyngbya sp. FACHB-16]|uniref:alpha-amylase family glycosyl hydrolase n=1 Tax=unclassified Leptolyngbya TaxID=2650499 RepID=UPI0016828053|nr:alpha-amylase family glycosyl hydrolase [Leptolyngbya sp. FACHB-16]MBD2157405.1 alpha amylase C-terminal domain-containing protein [Leptolyngbya sp. FACHB-16]